ncbi:MAG: catalase family peroxidase [Acetobacteraceae bacterium]|nr:catalase family peroxidase [Acetobacteraceae bacterium]
MTRSGLLAATFFAVLAAAPVTARAQGTTASQTVDVMNAVWGRHPGIRANHAKGVVVEGSFVPTAEAARLSKVAIFAGPPVPVTVRFSDSTGVPTLPDADALANPHGMGIQFRPETGGEVDVVVNSLPFFPVRTGEDFLELLQAIAASGPGAAKPTELDQFFAAHPAALPALTSPRTPTSFAREIYRGVDAFVLVNADGARQPFRFRFVPEAGTDYMSEAEAAKADPNVLVNELPARLANGPMRFRVVAQLANPGDPTDDATKPWPDDRRLADLGTISLDKVAADDAKAQSALHLLPNRLEPGIELSDDPLVTARVLAYLISFGRRAG